MPPSQTYPVSPTDFALYFASLPAQGAEITPTDSSSGVAVIHGYKLGYAYANGELTLTGIDKAIFSFPWSTVFAMVATHLTQPIAANTPPTTA
jgi:hypothetical protein